MTQKERSIRDIVLSIEAEIRSGSSADTKQRKFPKRFPIPLTDQQRDIAEIVLSEISKPFSITDFSKACSELAKSEGVKLESNGETNRSLRYFLCEQVGLAPTYRKS